MGQARDLLHIHVLGTRNAPGQVASALRVISQLLQVFAVDFHHHVLLGAADELIKPHLNGLLEAERHPRNGAHGRGHLFGQFCLVFGRGPLRLVLQNHQHVRTFHGHGVRGNFRRAYFGHHLFHFGEGTFQDARGLLHLLDGVAQGATCQGAGFHRKVPLPELRNKLAAQRAKQQEAAHQQRAGHPQHQPPRPQRPGQRGLVQPAKEVHHPVGEIAPMRSLAAEHQRGHHRHVSQGKNEGAQDGEGHGLGHGPKHLPLDAAQSQQRQVHNQDNNFAKRGRRTNAGSRLVSLLVHFPGGQPFGRRAFAQDQPVHNGLYDDDGPVHNQPKVDGPQAHQVATDAK